MAPDPDPASGATDFRALLAAAHRRPWLVLPDERYLTVATYVVGLDAATGGRLLHGFSAWLSARVPAGAPTPHWASHVVLGCFPELWDEGRWEGDLSAEEAGVAIDALFGLLDEFLAGRDHVYVVRPATADAAAEPGAAPQAP